MSRLGTVERAELALGLRVQATSVGIRNSTGVVWIGLDARVGLQQ